MTFDLAKLSGMGTDTINRNVLGLPFISIIQKGSPEFDETHKDYATKRIDGCKPGDLLFEPERLILKRPLELIPLAQSTHYTEWKPNKGGFVGHRPVSIVSHPDYRKGQKGTKTEFREYLGENELVYTMLFIVLFKVDDKWKKGMIAFTATQLKHARNWSKMILGIKYPDMPDVQPPIFAASYIAGTKTEQNKDGGWFGWDIRVNKILRPDADQALLETAFGSYQEAASLLPKPETVPSLKNGADAVLVAAEGADGERHF